MAFAIQVRTKGFQEVYAVLGDLKRRTLNVEPALKKGGLLMLQSINTNFQSGGRPLWKPLKLGTLRYKSRHGYSSLPLIRSGGLKRSIVYRTTAKKLTIGTSVPYAKFHQLGTRSIPKRIFLLFQKQDITNINKLIAEQVTGKRAY